MKEQQGIQSVSYTHLDVYKRQVQDGDVINWVYTCNLGKDVGDNSMY